ncbi:MAG: tRNA pseudouridine(13) synthase TruD [Candidatus Melainabacteria bacterium]|nr:tRNA pseudouridine(13) synthase TruD [Candidatus Melainabacteria bacterium]
MSTQFYFPSEGEFLDPALLEWLEKGTRPRARLKTTHEDFRVEEQGLCGTRYTADTVSNLTADQIATPPAPTRFIRVTVVKRGLTTGHTEHLLKTRFREQGFEVRITYAGNKDRTAITGQAMVIEIKSSPEGKDAMAAARKMSRPHELNGRDWFIKDPIYVQGPLSLGALKGNHFRIRLAVPGMNSQSITSYLQEKVAILEERNWMFPNAYGKQRRGRCQTNDYLGYAFLQLGPLAAFRMCLTLGAPDESDFAKEVRAALAQSWEEFEKARESGAPLAEQYGHFEDMHQILMYGPKRQRWGEEQKEPVHVRVNMPIEYALVTQAATTRDLDEVAMRLPREFSLWIGAIQAFWFNKSLLKYLQGGIPSLNKDSEIPLLVNKPRAIEFYGQHFPQALPGDYNRKKQRVFRLYNRVAKRYFEPFSAGPMRSLLAQVSDFGFKAGNEEVLFENMLPSGTFETTFLSMFFDLDSDYAANGKSAVEGAPFVPEIE